MKKDKRFAFRLDEETYKMVILLCKLEGRSFSNLIQKAVEEYIYKKAK